MDQRDGSDLEIVGADHHSPGGQVRADPAEDVGRQVVEWQADEK